MSKNSDKCGPCGRIFVRADKTEIVNRSDGKTFHVNLYSGPDLRPTISGGIYADQVICNFGYVHDRIGPKRNSLVVFIAHANEGRAKLLQQIEIAADKIARLVDAGQELEPIYTLDGGLLAPGSPK